MKKILYCALIALLAVSCVPTYSIRGNITCYSGTGEIIRQFDNVALESGHIDPITGTSYTHAAAIQSYGINFIDNNGNGIIISNALPYIIEYDTGKKISNYVNYTTNNSTTTINQEDDSDHKNKKDNRKTTYNGVEYSRILDHDREAAYERE